MEMQNKRRDLGFISTSSGLLEHPTNSNPAGTYSFQNNTLSTRADVAMLHSYHQRLASLNSTSDI
eukprot:m.118860 g.118860  ORF g.118860 m.118860 type:complete len:65 (-) comp9346_c3_seq8:2288-2482(-)